jgi:hypothetical protein
MKSTFRAVLVLALWQASLIEVHAGGQCSETKLANEQCVKIDDVDYPLCSTEKINNEDCIVVIDRRYPVTWPTIQMKPGRHVRVVVDHPLEFETLSLDETGFSLLPGTDQLASLVPNVIPQLKGLGGTSVSIPQEELAVPPPRPGPLTSEAQKAADQEQDLMELIHTQTEVMRSLLKSANKAIPDENSDLFQNARAIYEQLNQAMSPLPNPVRLKRANRDLFYRLQPYAIALYTCQGIPMLWEGRNSPTTTTSPITDWHAFTCAGICIGNSSTTRTDSRSSACTDA